jgi:hypothetical protein
LKARGHMLTANSDLLTLSKSSNNNLINRRGSSTDVCDKLPSTSKLVVAFQSVRDTLPVVCESAFY